MATTRKTLIDRLGLKVSQSDLEFLLSTSKPPNHGLDGQGDEINAWVQVLPERLVKFYRGALDQEWPFLPPDIRPDWLTSQVDLPPLVSHHLILLKCLLLALESERYAESSAFAFVLDRFMYMFGGARVILNVVSLLESRSRTIPIAPQMVIRKARVLKDSGDLHGAMRTLNCIMTTGWRAEGARWSYKSEHQYRNVYAVLVQIKGYILHNLGLWSEAIHLLVESIRGFENLPVPDEKGISSSQGLLAKCLKNLSVSEYASLRVRYGGFQQFQPCFEAYNNAVKAAQLCPNQSLFRARHLLEAGDSVLRGSAQLTPGTDRSGTLGTALNKLIASVSQHQSVKPIQSREQSYELLKALYLAGVCLMSSPIPSDVHLAWVVEELCIALYTIHCRSQEGLGQDPRAVELINLALSFLGVAKLDGELALTADDLAKGFEELKLGSEGTSASQAVSQIVGNNGAGNLQTVDSVRSDGEVKVPDVGQATQREQPNEAIDFDALAQKREVGLPADPRSPLYKSNPIEVEDTPSVDSDLSTPLQGDKQRAPRADPSAATLCSTYTIEALRALDSTAASGCSTDSSDMSTTDSGFEVIHDRIEFSDDAPKPHPLVTLRGVDQRQDQGQAGLDVSPSTDWSRRIEKVRDIVKENENNALNKSGASRARLWQFDPTAEKGRQWRPQSTLVFVGGKVPLKKGKEGSQRDALHVEFLHQDEPLGKYVAKRYRRKVQRQEDNLLDVESQMVARFYVTLFNQKLQSLSNLEGATHIQYLPAAHLQVQTPQGRITDLLNVEPFLEGDSEFVKLTNNYAGFNQNVGENMLNTALAFTHFSYAASGGKSMIVDLQGWLPSDTNDVVYLTDPQFNSVGDEKFSSCDQREEGMTAFWNTVHPRCNRLCSALGLKRPEARS